MIDNPDNSLNTELMPDTVALIGIPFDEYSSFMRGPAKAPSAIRQTLHNGASNWFAENGVNLDTHPLFRDLGDLTLPGVMMRYPPSKLPSGGWWNKKPGSWHWAGITPSPIRWSMRLTNTHDNLTILHLDAHPDLYDSYDGNRFSHACPFARIMETGRVKRLVQVGIRGMNDEQRRQVDKFGVTCIEMKDYRSKNPIALEGPLYLSVDMDVLDPAYAPGVSHHEPGGMSTRKVLRLIQSIQCPIVGADIVEVNPDRDVNGMTAAVAAKLVKEIAGMMIRQVK